MYKAKHEINIFKEKFGEAHLFFAYHAAFPVILTPYLSYQIWFYFRTDINNIKFQNDFGESFTIPWTAVSDLFFSNICNEIGYAEYEIKREVRHELLYSIIDNQKLGKKRIMQLANFIYSYYSQNQDHLPDHEKYCSKINKNYALAYLKPDEIDEKLYNSEDPIKNVFYFPLSEFPKIKKTEEKKAAIKDKPFNIRQFNSQIENCYDDIQPTLIIGIGEIGAKITKGVYNNLYDSQKEKKEKIEFILIDTEEVKKEKGMDIIQLSTNINSHELSVNENYKEWCPIEIDTIKENLFYGTSKNRKLARLSFLTSINPMTNNIFSILEKKINKLKILSGEESAPPLRAVIICSIGGGTGSGTFIQTSLYLKKILHSKVFISCALINPKDRNDLLTKKMKSNAVKVFDEIKCIKKNDKESKTILCNKYGKIIEYYDKIFDFYFFYKSCDNNGVEIDYNSRHNYISKAIYDQFLSPINQPIFKNINEYSNNGYKFFMPDNYEIIYPKYRVMELITIKVLNYIIINWSILEKFNDKDKLEEEYNRYYNDDFFDKIIDKTYSSSKKTPKAKLMIEAIKEKCNNLMDLKKDDLYLKKLKHCRGLCKVDENFITYKDDKEFILKKIHEIDNNLSNFKDLINKEVPKIKDYLINEIKNHQSEKYCLKYWKNKTDNIFSFKYVVLDLQKEIQKFLEEHKFINSDIDAYKPFNGPESSISDKVIDKYKDDAQLKNLVKFAKSELAKHVLIDLNESIDSYVNDFNILFEETSLIIDYLQNKAKKIMLDMKSETGISKVTFEFVSNLLDKISFEDLKNISNKSDYSGLKNIQDKLIKQSFNSSVIKLENDILLKFVEENLKNQLEKYVKKFHDEKFVINIIDVVEEYTTLKKIDFESFLKTIINDYSTNLKIDILNNKCFIGSHSACFDKLKENNVNPFDSNSNLLQCDLIEQNKKLIYCERVTQDINVIKSLFNL